MQGLLLAVLRLLHEAGTQIDIWNPFEARPEQKGAPQSQATSGH